MFSLCRSCRHVIRDENVKILLAFSEYRTLQIKRFIANSSLRCIAMSSKYNKEEQPESVSLAWAGYGVPPDHPSDNDIPIVILHGLLGCKNNWNSLAKAIHMNINKRPVYAVDARNHGDSPHADEFSYPIMVSDLLKFLKDRDISKASFIGHSMGGRVCMLLALTNPHLVKSLVIVDISPVHESSSLMDLPKIFDMIDKLDLRPDMTLHEARKQATIQLKENNQDDKFISFLLTNLVGNEPTTNWRWKFNLKSITKQFSRSISKFPSTEGCFEKPTLFVAGGSSDYIRKEDEPAIRSFFPVAQFEYIAGAGHWVHAEKPQLFLSAISEFFKKNEN